MAITARPRTSIRGWPGLSLLALVVVLSAGTSRAQAQEPIATQARSSNIEWFGMNVGVGRVSYNLDNADANGTDLVFDKLVAHADFLIANLAWPYAYLTVAEVHPLFLFGFIGGGPRAGVRLPLTANYRHELRVGSFVGADLFMYGANSIRWGVSLRPHVQYVYNNDSGTIGAGFDLLFNLPLSTKMEEGDGRGIAVDRFMTGYMFYLRWTVGRTPRSSD